MSDINRAKVEEKLSQLKQSKEQLVAQTNATIGAIAILEEILKEELKDSV